MQYMSFDLEKTDTFGMSLEQFRYTQIKNA